MARRINTSDGNGRLIEAAEEAMKRDYDDVPKINRQINRRLMQAIHKAAKQDGLLTRPDIEEMAGVASSVATDWFHKCSVPDAPTIGKLARGLHVNSHWLLTDQGPKSTLGEGRGKADELFTIGAASVINDVRDKLQALLETLEATWSASILTHENAVRWSQVASGLAARAATSASQRAAEVSALAHRERQMADVSPRRRRKVRKRLADQPKRRE